MNRNIFNIDEFIKQHDHICYCEAVVYPNGTISYAVPSHQEVLLRIYGKIKGIDNKEELWKTIPVSEFSIYWLPDNTGCAIVWYNNYILPKNATKEQKDSIKKLIQNKVMSPDISIPLLEKSNG